jgi:hypothetical protein
MIWVHFYSHANYNLDQKTFKSTGLFLLLQIGFNISLFYCKLKVKKLGCRNRYDDDLLRSVDGDL